MEHGVGGPHEELDDLHGCEAAFEGLRDGDCEGG